MAVYVVLDMLLIMVLLVLVGMKDGQQIRFSAEGDQEPGIEPGDIIVVLDEQKHGVFKRRGNDLFIDFEVDLVDALCGFQKTIETLDKRTLLVTSLPGIFCSFISLFGVREVDSYCFDMMISLLFSTFYSIL